MALYEVGIGLPQRICNQADVDSSKFCGTMPLQLLGHTPIRQDIDM